MSMDPSHIIVDFDFNEKRMFVQDNKLAIRRIGQFLGDHCLNHCFDNTCKQFWNFIPYQHLVFSKDCAAAVKTFKATAGFWNNSEMIQNTNWLSGFRCFSAKLVFHSLIVASLFSSHFYVVGDSIRFLDLLIDSVLGLDQRLN